MKPIKLIISAFGPYACKMPEINFEQFEDKGLFLISGDTGSGKTTIFDAICFALYGTTSGTYRDTKNLRSEYAKDTVESYVDFYFSHQGRMYHVWRQPTYERKKQRGEGVITEKEKAVLYVEGDAPIEGLTQVNQAIKELLHIDDKQFKQIAMIAQGEFWNLLNAKTEQRTEILRTIFMTNAYKDMEEKLKKRMDANNQNRLKSEQSIIQHLEDVTCDEEDALFEALQEIQTKAKSAGSVWNLEEVLSVLDSVIVSDQQNQIQTSAELERMDAEFDEIKANLATAESNNKYVERLEKLEAECAELETRKEKIEELEALLQKQKAATYEVNKYFLSWKAKNAEVKAKEKQIEETKAQIECAKIQLDEAKQNLLQAQTHKPELDELEKKIEKIAEEKSKYQQKHDLTEKLATAKKHKKEIDEAEAKQKNEQSNLAEKIESLKQKEDELQDKPIELWKVENESKELKQLDSSIKEILEKQVKERIKRHETLSEKQEIYIRYKEEYQNADNERAMAEQVLEDCRAGILASKLEEGMKCPVCGSLHHPELAKLPLEAMTEEAFKNIKDKAEVCRAKKEKASKDAEVAKNALEEYESQMKDAAKKCLEHVLFHISTENQDLDVIIENLEKAKEILTCKISEKAALYKQVKDACHCLEQAKEERENAEDEISVLKEKAEKLQKQKSDIEISIIESRTALNTLETLCYPDWDTASQAQKEAETKAANIKCDIDTAEKAKTKAEHSLTAAEASLETSKADLEKLRKAEENEQENLNEALGDKHFKSLDDMLYFVVLEEEIAGNEREINDYKRQKTMNDEQLLQAKQDAVGRKLVDVESLKVVCNEMKTKVDDVRKQENAILNRINGNVEKKNYILAQKNDLETSRKEYNICKRLYELVRGTTGNGKITLEQYVQAAGFDAIIAAANRRLQPMSDNQYELYRKEDGVGKKSNNFLDLEVLDHYTGYRRPVGNLSGGESFKASLSLALGLSDTVSSSLGGVQMDALFIDEGFGTLDRKSIESAMDILLHLSGANKLVGVISHREELIENIPQQIHIQKTKDGSQIDIERGI